MRYATLFRRAWKITTKSKRLLWFLFMPALAQVAMYSTRMAWQSYRYAAEFGYLQEDFMLARFLEVFAFIAEKNLVSTIITFSVFVIAIQYLLMPMVEGTMYLAIHQKFTQPDSYVSLRQKMLVASKHFFQLFELNAVLRFFQLSIAIIWIISIYRYTIGGMWVIIRPLILVYFIISIFITFFAVYSPFFVLFEGSGFRKAIKQSIGLSFLFFRQTLTLFFMMVLISFRIVLNVLLVFLVPFIIFVLLGTLGVAIGWILGIIIGLGVLGLVAYLNALLDIFIGGVWVRAFMALREKQKKLNVDPTA